MSAPIICPRPVEIPKPTHPVVCASTAKEIDLAFQSTLQYNVSFSASSKAAEFVNSEERSPFAIAAWKDPKEAYTRIAK